MLLSRAKTIFFYYFPAIIFDIHLKYGRRLFIWNSRQKAYLTCLEPIENQSNSQLHPADACLQHLIAVDGAGTWPPQASFGEAWPAEIYPYHQIYLELAPSLSSKELSSDNETNFKRCLEFRAKMRKLLHEQVNLTHVTKLLSLAENKDQKALSAEAWNGLFACIAQSRHAFRYFQPTSIYTI